MQKARTCIILGAKGFIGAAVAHAAKNRDCLVTAVDLDNYNAMRGARADILINAAGNSRKYLDDRDPLQGYELSVSSVMRILRDFHYDCFVHLSSGAVYPREDDPRANAEAVALDPSAMTNYGFHKWLAEQLVLKYAPRHVILRMGGFVGPGLKKNAIHDLLAGGELRVHPDSEFQFMDTRDLARSIFDLLPKLPASRAVYNISARGVVSMRQAAAWIGCRPADAAEQMPLCRAELNVEKIGALLDLPDTRETVRRFLREKLPNALE